MRPRTTEELASEIAAEIRELSEQRDQYRDLAQRVQADFENYRKRVQAQIRDEADRATARLADSLLPVLDATEAAYLRHPDEIGPLLNVLLSELKKQGLETLHLQDEPFDPNLAEAVAHEPARAATSSSPRCCAAATAGTVARCGRRWSARATEREQQMAAQREWFEKDYYAILGVPDTSTPKEITKAYRKLARELHPDKNPGNAEAEERFKSVSAAYDVLGDETKRTEYDEVRRLGPMGGPGGASGPGGFTFNMNDADVGGLDDLLGQMFGRRGGGRPGGGTSSGAGPRRGADVEAELTLDFVDAARGLTTTLHLTSDAQCSTCHGSGARPGTVPKLCPQCGGRGVIDDNQGLFSFSSPCRRCGGAGTVIEDPCPTCRGLRRREAGPRGAGPHPRRRVRRPDDPAQGARCARAQRRSGRRPAGADPRRPASAVRAQRQRPDHARRRVVRRGRAGRPRRRPDPRRLGGHAAPARPAPSRAAGTG